MSKGALLGKEGRERRRRFVIELSPSDTERLNTLARARERSAESVLHQVVRESLADRSAKE